MRTTIRMNPELARQAKALASRSGQTFTQLIERAVAELISKEDSGGRGRKRKRIKLLTSGGDGIVDGLTLEEAIERAQLEADLAKLGLKPDDSPRP